MRAVYFITGLLFVISAASTIRLPEFTYAPADWLWFLLAVVGLVLMAFAQRTRR